ncbi:MAG TPA: DUF6573 family protein [Opitutaceae bacterium]|nr:DUF6573 family protein [Lacunisphaera sp.]HWA10424.1 DUF6573 family protein [Opitutaceae bacterium]
MKTENPFGETIYAYTRKQAIEDGVLVDLSHVDCMRQHWKHHFACTAAVWSIIEEALKVEGQDVAGICHDISTMAKLATHGAHNTSVVRFEVIVAGAQHALKLHVGPGDTPDPVLTLMLPIED